MNIAIIGAGNVGVALGCQWIKAKHSVVFGVRDVHSEKAIKTQEGIAGAKLQTIEEAASAAEVIVFTTPAHAIMEIIPQLGDMTGKVLIDATNAIRMKPAGYETAYHALAATTMGWVVKCFNSTGFENMQNPVYEVAGQNVGIDMFAAGNSLQAKQIAKQLALDAGFGECYDFGGDDKVVLLEQFALSWINLAIMQGHGRGLGFKLLKR